MLPFRETHIARLLNTFETRRGNFPDNTRVLRANSTFGQASIIGLADPNHTVPENIQHNFEIADTYSKPGDTILLEGGDRASFKKVTPSGLIVAGWDDGKAFEEYVQVAKEIALFTSQAGENIHKANLLDIQSSLTKAEAALKRLEELKAIRNTSLVRAINDTRSQSPMKKVFVLAGMNHLLGSRQVLTRLRQERFVVVGRKNKGETGTSVEKYLDSLE